MVLFLVLTALYFVGLLFMALKKTWSIEEELRKETFLSREHTDAIKGAAAVGIVISHIATLIKNSVGGPVRYYVVLCTTLGGIGVNLFFFASGFGNYYSIRKLSGLSPKAKWLLKRILSVLCIYIVCFVLVSIILSINGCHQSITEYLKSIVLLRMPLRRTWYLKVQILLYVILFISVLFTNKTKQAVLLVGLSLLSSLLYYRFGYAEEWWKSTMCFSAGYYCAMYKEEIIRLMNKNRKRIGWISMILCPVFFVMACLIDSFVIKMLGNTLLMASMMVLAELVRFDNRLARKLGTISLELYLIHISMCSWFLRDRVPNTTAIVGIILWSTAASLLAKLIDDKVLAQVKKI